VAAQGSHRFEVCRRGFNVGCRSFDRIGIAGPRSPTARSWRRGWTYVSDLIGCTVADGGKKVGRIEDVQFGAGEAPLLIVTSDAGGKRFDVPFAEAYLESVDVEQRQVRMNLPEGMLEINFPMTAEEKQQQHSERKQSEEKKRR
jgi:hypothetical protein